VSPGARHWYVPMCHDMEEISRFSPQHSGRIVCTSKRARDEILSNVYDGDPSQGKKISWCLWDSGLDAVASAYGQRLMICPFTFPYLLMS
jgi:hypothetical protein